ncbi:MAG: excinuclease ABC subunit UvrC [Candidatus Woesearchaeota archaeon]|jgi:excinuclease ABC subunit C
MNIAITKEINYNEISTSPGVYIYKDSSDNIIYIGKAKNLRNRVKSYFTQSKDKSIKTQMLVSKICFVEFIVVNNEVEALILENNLIKKHTPKYNINLKDSKTYAYIKITNEKFPRIISTRKIEKDSAKYFGPYTSGYSRQELVKLIIKLYKIRICKNLPKKACLQYHMNLCDAPCINNISEEQYSKNVIKATELLKGDTKEIISQLNQNMQDFSKKQEYEKANNIKKIIESIDTIFSKQTVDKIKKYDQDVIALLKNGDDAIIIVLTISKGTILGKKEFFFDYTQDLFAEFLRAYYSSIDSYKIPNEIIVSEKFWEDELALETFIQYLKTINNETTKIICPKQGDKLALVALAMQNAELNLISNPILHELKENLNLLDLPKIIECFDISNLGYEHIVAGMTRYTNGKPDKKEYRKFLIQSVSNKNDDFASMKEVIYRRYKKLLEENATLPNLIMVDGGRGQLECALNSLNKLNLKIEVISLAKKNEEIYTMQQQAPLTFKKTSRMMLLLRQIRDSTHNYVIAYNKKRREMKLKEEFKAL